MIRELQQHGENEAECNHAVWKWTASQNMLCKWKPLCHTCRYVASTSLVDYRPSGGELGVFVCAAALFIAVYGICLGWRG